MSQRARRGAGEDAPQAAGTWWSLLQRRRWPAWQNGPRTQLERPPGADTRRPTGTPGDTRRGTLVFSDPLFLGGASIWSVKTASRISVLLKSDLPKEKSSKRPASV